MSEPKIFDAVTYNPDGTRTYFQYVRIEDYDSLKAKADKLEAKINKLKQLMLLTDPVVSGEVVNDIALKQWNEFIKCFPEEGDVLCEEAE